MFEAKLLIGADDIEAVDAATFERRDPGTGEVATIAAAASIADAQRAANAAAAAFPAWSETNPASRRDVLNKAADCLLARRDEFYAAMISEIGATRAWAEFNVNLAESILRDAAAMTTQIVGQVIPSDQPDMLSFGVRQAAGVCLGIAPWNAPVVLGFRAIAMPLACGNTVVLKASELCPKTHRLIGEVMRDAGVERGAINVVTNAPVDAEAVVQALIAHPAVRRVNFTGSTRVGRMVAETAAKYLKRCLLELGGKAVTIVLADADIDEAVKAIAFGAFMNQGQICMSTERVIVLDEIADTFVAKFAERARTLLSGEQRGGGTPLGGLVGIEAAKRLTALIEDAVDKGAALRSGGPAVANFMDATVVDRVTPAMRIYHEECFGPIASVIRAGSVDEAVTIANDCDYGLSSAVFSKDVMTAMAVARRVEAGICHINSATVADEPQAPFGGVKASGYGRFGGTAAIDEFTELRWLTVTGGPVDYPI